MSVFLSCFRKKKKGDKKKGDKKNNAPIAAPSKEPTPSPKATADNNKSPVTVEDQSKDDVRRLNGSKEFQETNEPLGDFSAVRETEVLKSGSNDELFRTSDDMNTSTPDTSRDENEGNERAEKDKDDGAKELDGSVKKMDTSKESSQGRSSMLEEINSTLASIHTNDTGNSAEDIPKEVKDTKIEAAAAIVPIDIRKSMEDIAKAVQQKVNAATKIADEEKDEKETKVESDSEDVSDKKFELDEMKKVESTQVESAVADIAGEIKEKEIEFEKEIEEQAVCIEKEVGSCLHNGIDSVKEDADHVKIEDIACKVEDDVVTNIETKVEMAEIKVTESLGVDNHKDDEEEVVVTETFQIEVEKHKEKEKKIPPKVSPKPSPKMKPRSIVQNIVANVATESSDPSQKSEEEAEEKAPPSPKSFVDKIVEKVEEVFTGSAENNGEIENNEVDEKMDEKVDSPPATPTTPTSPTSPTLKGQSRIPTSKKASGIPKLAFSSPKPASPSSPISSPADSAVKRLDHAAADLTKTNHTNDTPSSPTSPTGDSDLTRDTKESSPFNDDNRNSKRKLTKLRYSGRKKSSESKSDESGSERGSRAGSEVKEEVAEMEKNSRIPVRGGSKPRSSPPKSLGN